MNIIYVQLCPALPKSKMSTAQESLGVNANVSKLTSIIIGISWMLLKAQEKYN
ncbi:hypothetical protein CDL15_Pgr001315 [Punica granatum]|uniref:Uncharacterized protein n=1 Tax=Punica granatum TaxID=22663 RepID=A0A218WLS1_PUNGR|nr:hypothetical protein CDL15_Pgr001315 [Punica granatum]